MKMILLLLIAVLLLPGVVSSSTSAYFSDTEISPDNSVTAAELVTVSSIDDSFESDPWDANWDDNGTTSWLHSNNTGHSGSYGAECTKNANGYLTSDDLNATGASIITISFWFQPKSIEAGDVLIQLYDGSTYDTWYDLADYPTYQQAKWCYFEEEIIDDFQYFNSDFRLRFDGSGLVDGGENCIIDDVLVEMKKWP